MSTLLIVENLPRTFLDDELRNIVQPFGQIVSACLVRDHYGKSLEFEFVDLETDEPACVISELKGKDIHGRGIVVSQVQSSPFGNS